MIANLREALQSACTDIGILFRDVPVDGRWHETDVEGDRRGSSNGRIKLFPDGEGGIVCNWKGARRPFFVRDARELNGPERAEVVRKRRDAVQRSQGEEARCQAEAERKAQAIWQTAELAPNDHPYLVDKRIKAHGARLHKGALVIPLWLDGELRSLQFIQPNGDKRFLAGGRVKGCYFFIGTVKGASAVCVAEGFGTAASIHAATGHPVAVAFNAGNLEEVAKIARHRFPDLPLILCADDDYRTADNPGLTMATAAAKVVGARLAVPDFGRDRPEGATDFNDMLTARGIEEVRRAIGGAKEGRQMSREQPDPPGPDIGQVKEPPAYLDDGLPRKAGGKAQVSATTKAEVESDVDYMAALPEPDEAIFHGLIGEVARTASAGTEVNPVAAAATFMAFLSASVGPSPHVMIGNRRHSLLIWPLHNGRTSVGGKGMAHDLTDLIRGRLREHIGVEAPLPIAAPKLRGRLSTGEGLAHAIRDPREPTHENDPGDPGEPDKRVYAVETEFAGVLFMTRREGCSLSPVLRDAFDGNPIGSQTKTAKSTCEKPHVVVVGAITPRELLAEVTDKEVANGLINRFLIFFAERIDVVPFPPSTLPEQVEHLARHAGEAIRWAWAAERSIRLDDEARALYESYYHEFNRSQRRSGDSESVKMLCERHPPYARRIAALYAVADGKEVVNADHMRAALAWVRYSADSIRLLFNAGGAVKRAHEAGEAHREDPCAVRRWKGAHQDGDLRWARQELRRGRTRVRNTIAPDEPSTYHGGAREGARARVEGQALQEASYEFHELH